VWSQWIETGDERPERGEPLSARLPCPAVQQSPPAAAALSEVVHSASLGLDERHARFHREADTTRHLVTPIAAGQA
jgi:hypothetical protein